MDGKNFRFVYLAFEKWIAEAARGKCVGVRIQTEQNSLIKASWADVWQ